MKQTNVRWLVAVLFCSFIAVAGCKKSKNDDPKPATEVIQKSWKVKEAKEDGTKVYDAAASSNTNANYAKFKLTLTATTASLTTVDGNSFNSPSWTLANNTLTLKTPTPAMTGVSGDLVYTSVSVSDTELKMTRSQTDPKTGAGKTEYVLVPAP